MERARRCTSTRAATRTRATVGGWGGGAWGGGGEREAPAGACDARGAARGRLGGGADALPDELLRDRRQPGLPAPAQDRPAGGARVPASDGGGPGAGGDPHRPARTGEAGLS